MIRSSILARGLDCLFSASIGAANLESVAITFGVTVSGEIGIPVAKAGLQTTSSITLTYKR